MGCFEDFMEFREEMDRLKKSAAAEALRTAPEIRQNFAEMQHPKKR
jgi:hypothetical protein